MKRKRIYITYCWQDEKIVDIIDSHFQQIGIKLIRDKRDLDYASSIEKFARKMRNSSYNICIISDAYLRRINCMYEIIQLLKDDNFINKKFCPIIVDTSNKQVDLTSEGIESYAQFWRKELDNQDRLIDGIAENRNKSEQINQLKKIEEIYNNIREFLFSLKDIKYICASDINTQGIKVIDENIFKKIGISSRINIEELYNITLIDDIEDAESKLAEYANNHLLKDNEYYLFTKATIYEKFKHFDLALYNYRLAYNINNNFIVALESIIFLYLKGIFKIDKCFENIVSLLNNADKGNITLKIANALMGLQKGNIRLAINTFEEILQTTKYVNHKEYMYNNLAIAYEKLYESEKNNEFLMIAEQNYLLSVKENPNYYQAYNNLALFYLIKLSDLSKAQEAISRCLYLCPTYHMGLNTQGLIYEETREYEKALELYFRAYEHSKSFSPPLNQIGRILDFEYNNSICKLYYSLAYDINPKSLVNIFNLGNYYRKYTNDLDKAGNLLFQALNMDKNNILCNMAIGLLKMKIGDFFSAKQYFSYSLLLNPQYSCAIFCLAVSEIKSGADYSKVLLLLEKYNKNNYCTYIEKLIIEVRKRSSDINAVITQIIKNNIEYEYVNVPDQISKSIILNPILNVNDAYQYIINNFYSINS